MSGMGGNFTDEVGGNTTTSTTVAEVGSIQWADRAIACFMLLTAVLGSLGNITAFRYIIILILFLHRPSNYDYMTPATSGIYNTTIHYTLYMLYTPQIAAGISVGVAGVPQQPFTR